MAYDIFKNTKSSSSSKKKKDEEDDLFPKVAAYSSRRASDTGSRSSSPASEEYKSRANGYTPTTYIRDYGRYGSTKQSRTPSNDFKASVPSVTVESAVNSPSKASSENRKKEINDRLNELNMSFEEAYLLTDAYSRAGLENSDQYRQAQAMHDSAKKEIAELENELKQIENYDKYSGKVRQDNFFGQAAASYDLGSLQQKESLAWNAYVANPTENNKHHAESISQLLAQYSENNAAALDDDATLPWVSQTLAGYVPQLLGQVGASVAGGAVGGLTGAGVGSVVPGIGTATGATYGIKAGIVAGSGAYSYNTMRGAAYKGLIDAGVPEDVALAAANDEAVVSALIEMADTGIDVATLGVGTLVKSLAKGGAKTVAKTVAKEGAEAVAESAMKKFAKGLGKYGLNIAGEYAEEYAQETVSMANEQRTKAGDVGNGFGGLAYDAAAKMFTMTDEEREQAHEAGVEGAKIAAMLGGATSLATNTATAYIENKGGKPYSSDIDALIEEGLQSDPSSESYQIATQLKAKMDSGNSVSNREAYRLATANQKAIDLETEQASTEAVATEAAPVQTAVSAPVKTRAQTIESRLTESGMDATQATSVARSLDRIIAGDTTVTNKDKDILSVGNPITRQIFTEETGVALPSSNASTRKAVSEYIANTAISQQPQQVEAKPVENVMTAWQNQKAQEQTVSQLKDNAPTFAVTTNSAEATLRQAAQEAVNRSKKQDVVINQTNMASLGEKGKAAYQKHIGNAKSVSGFSNAFQRYYDAGQIGVPFEQIKTAYDGAADRSVLFEAYSAGKNDAFVRTESKSTTEKKTKPKGKNKASMGKGRFYDNRSREGAAVAEKDITALKQVARAFNVDIEVVDTIADSEGRSIANGYYKNGKIVIAADSDNPMMTVLKHEITHHLQRVSPKQYKAFKDYVMKAYYNNSQEAMNAEIQRRITLANLNNMELTRTEAMDEIVADATESFLTDRDSIDALIRENRSLGETILNAIRDVLRKVEAALKGEDLKGYSSFMNADQLRAAEKMWVEALAAASKSEIGVDSINISESSAPIWSLKSMKFDILDGKMQRDLVEHKILTVEETNHLMSEISKLIDKMSPFAHIVDMNEEYGKDNRPFAVYKPNSDPLYKVSLDFSTLCKKRLMTQFVMESLQTKLGKALSAKEQIAIRSKLEEYGKVNEQIQVACALCYVEARRLKAPDQINRFLDNKTEVLTDYFGKKNKAYKQSVDDMAAKMKVEMGYKADTALKAMKPADKKKINTAKQKMMKEYVPSAEEQKIIAKANAIDNAEFLSQAGLTRLNLNEPVIYDAFVTHVRNATKSKALEGGVPYYYGDSKSVSDALLNAMNAENGLRHQSWSDFEIVHLLDTIAAVIDLSVRKAKVQSYTKVPAFVHVNGNTGMMINLSLIPAGKNGMKDGKLDFSPVEGMDYNVAVDLRDQYHKTSGTIAIGIDDTQMDMLLSDPTIDYVIPYHTSGMNAQLRKMAGIAGWADYESYQSEKEIKGAKQGNCPDELWHKKPDFSEWFDTSKLDMSKSGVEIMREAANRYLQLCKERGLSPKFSNTKKHTDFSKHKNYWKLLIDRKMVDGDGNIIIQQEVRPIFDFDKISEIVQTEIDNYDPTLLDSINDMITKEWESGGIKQREAELLADEKAKKKAEKKSAKVQNGLMEQVVAPEQVKKNTTEDGGKQFSLKGYTADGTEVYETSEETLSLPWNERKKIFKDLMGNDYRGRTARFYNTRTGEYDYATFTDDDIGKAIYGNKKSDQAGRDAFVNTGADGSVFDLVENAKHDSYGEEKGKKTKAHKNVAMWDYYVKTVQIDGMVFDMVINVRQKPDGEFVYSVQLNENKNKTPAPILARAYNHQGEMAGRESGSHTDVSKETVPQPKDSVKVFSLKDSDYMDAVKSGDMETAQKMVDQAANEAFKNSVLRDKDGNLIKVYHGSPAKFNVFKGKEIGDIGNYFSPWKSFAEEYGETRAFYLDLTNPVMYDYDFDAINEVSEEDSDGFIYVPEDIEDGIDQNKVGDTEIVVYDSNKIKSADPVTYDDDGNVIPLSKRFDSEKDDIRYQLKSPDEMLEMSKQIAEAEHKAKAVTDAEVMSQAVKDMKLTGVERDIVKNYQEAAKKLADYEKRLAVYEATEAEHGKGRSIYTDKAGNVKKSGVKYSAAERAEIQRKIEWWKRRLREIERKEEFKKVLKREKAKMAERHAKEISDLRGKYDARLADLREKRDAKIEAEKQRMRDYKQHQRDSKAYKELKGKLETDVKWLNERLTNPTDAKHIPEEFRKGVAAFLNSLDFETKYTDAYEVRNGKASQKVIRLGELKDAYEKILKDDGSTMELDAVLLETLKQLEKVTENRRVVDLDYQELSLVRDTIHYLKQNIVMANKFFNESIKETVAVLGDKAITEQRDRKPKKDRVGLVGVADKHLNYDSVTPADKFHEYGGVMEKMYKEIRKGFNKHIENTRTTIDYVQNLLKGHEDALKEWSGDNAKTTKFSISDGTTIELTPAQVMSLYCLQKREQALGHILGSGIVPSNVVVKEAKRYGKLKVNVAKRITSEKASRCIPEDIQKIVGTLTEEQKKVADGIVTLFTTKCADWGNETSMKLYGYKKFNEANYFPIKSSDAYLNARFDESGDSLIKNLGFTKNTVVNANNPVVVDDIFDVLTDHANKMSMYNALVVPLTDFTRVFNYKDRNNSGEIIDSTQKAMETADGQLGINYVKQFIKDINKEANSLAAESFALQALSNYKKAKIAASSRVLVQQPTSITRAANMVDPKYLAAGLQQKANYEELFTYSEIAYWKSLGFYQTDVSRSMRDVILSNESKLDQYTMGVYGKADDFTWGHLWNAIKLEQADAHPDVDKTSSEFMDLVKERFEEVVDRTQVVDSVFHRSQIMRSKGAFAKMATAFMSESTKQYNLLRTELMDASKTKDKQKAARAIVTYVANAVVVSAFAAIVDMIRDDDDEDEEGNKRTLGDKYLDALLGNIKDNINPLNLVAYLKEISSIWSGYSVNRMDMASLSEVIKTANKWTQGRYTAAYMAKETAEDIADLFGIPLKNAVREVTTIIGAVGDLVGGHYYADYMVSKAKYNINNPDNRSVFYKHYTDALAAGDQEAADLILADMVVNGIPYDNIISKGYQSQKVDAFSEARNLIADGKTEEAKKLIRKLAKEYDKKYTTLWKAVKNGDPANEPEETYDYKDLKTAVRKGEDTELIEDYLIDYGGYSEEAIEEAIKMLTEKYN